MQSQNDRDDNRPYSNSGHSSIIRLGLQYFTYLLYVLVERFPNTEQCYDARLLAHEQLPQKSLPPFKIMIFDCNDHRSCFCDPQKFPHSIVTSYVSQVSHSKILIGLDSNDFGAVVIPEISTSTAEIKIAEVG